ncbi:MAG: methyl-viologen-reducing hydrogenase subunit delta, partial [Bacteroidales bacterium]
MKEKIGVYICHCGGNISDYVDTDKVRETIQHEDGVYIAKDVMFACADSTQKEIVDDIKAHKLDGIVVASCSPKLHLYTFRNVAERAGLNPYNYVQANIREQCSWTHTDKPKEATIKAIRLVRGAINRVKHSQALSQFEISAHNAVLVVGAGVAGMR